VKGPVECAQRYRNPVGEFAFPGIRSALRGALPDELFVLVDCPECVAGSVQIAWNELIATTMARTPPLADNQISGLTMICITGPTDEVFF
jgi:hypothetical protein